jgi:hypothetical protein
MTPTLYLMLSLLLAAFYLAAGIGIGYARQRYRTRHGRRR